MHDEASTTHAPRPNRWFQRTLLLIVGVTLARVLYLFLLCPYDLVEDEATYWEWSRRLDLSYYTKGPGIALAIRAATSLLGDSEAAIRSVSVVASAIAALALATLGAEAARLPGSPRNWHVAFVTASLFFLVPIFQALALLATIDGPYVACWAIASLSAFLAIERRRAWAWPLLGLALGVGFLFKYTILLLIPGLIVFAFLRRARFRRTSTLASFSLGAALFAASIAPVLIWNHQQGWPTIAHLLGHLGVAGGDMPASPSPASKGWSYDPRWTLEFIAIQFAMVGPALVLAIGVAVKAWRTRRSSPDTWPATLFLLACSLPIFLFYLLVSFVAEPEGNWAVGGYLTLLPLAAHAVVNAFPRFRAQLADWHALPHPRPKRGFLRKRPEVFEQVLWHWSIAFGLVAAIGMARVDLLARAFPPVAGRIASIITADVLAADAHQRAQDLARETGLEPFYIAQHYGRASILAYYIPDHPSVKCSSSRMAGRRTNYDYWQDTDLDDPSLLGRPAVLVGATFEQWAPLFDRVVPVDRLQGEHKKERLVFLGYGYRGWPPPTP